MTNTLPMNAQVRLQYYETIGKSSEEQLSNHWRATTEEQYWDMLEVLPPHAHKGTAFLVGECLTYGIEGKIYQAYARVDGRYYTRPAYDRYFDPADYTEQIKSRLP